MKRKIFWLIFISITLVMAGCWGNNDKSNPFDVPYNNSSGAGYHSVTTPELYGVGVAYKPATMTSSSLYKIASDNGAATLIGDIGYYVVGIAYDNNKKKLYGIASGDGIGGRDEVKTVRMMSSQLIEINMDTGKGKLIGDITVEDEYKYPVSKVNYFNNPTFNSAGTLYAWNETDQTVCTIDLLNGNATCGMMEKSADIELYDGKDNGNVVLSFNNENVLYMIDGLNVFTVNTHDYTKKFQGKLKMGMTVYNGDFNPVTEQFWALHSNEYRDGGNGGSEYTDNLFVINVDERTLIKQLSVPDNIEAITWVYDLN